MLDDLRHAWRLHETVMGDHTDEPVAHGVDLDPLVTRHTRRIFGLNGEDDVALVQHTVVLEVVHERRRRRSGIAREKYRGSWYPMRRLGLQLAHQPFKLGLVLAG